MKTMLFAASLLVGSALGGAFIASTNTKDVNAQSRLERSERSERSEERVIEIEGEEGTKRYVYRDGEWQGEQPPAELLELFYTPRGEESRPSDEPRWGPRRNPDRRRAPRADEIEDLRRELRELRQAEGQPNRDVERWEWRESRPEPRRGANPRVWQDGDVEVEVLRAGGPSAAAMPAEAGTFEIIESEWGVLKLDTRNGQSWLLDKNAAGEVTWKPIREQSERRRIMAPGAPSMPEANPALPTEREYEYNERDVQPMNREQAIEQMRESFEQRLRESGLSEDQKQQARERFERMLRNRMGDNADGAAPAPRREGPDANPRMPRVFDEKLERALELEKEAAELQRKLEAMRKKQTELESRKSEERARDAEEKARDKANEDARRAEEERTRLKKAIEEARRKAQEDAERRERESRRNSESGDEY